MVTSSIFEIDLIRVLTRTIAGPSGRFRVHFGDSHVELVWSWRTTAKARLAAPPRPLTILARFIIDSTWTDSFIVALAQDLVDDVLLELALLQLRPRDGPALILMSCKREDNWLAGAPRLCSALTRARSRLPAAGAGCRRPAQEGGQKICRPKGPAALNVGAL